jgi:2'-hydroxyisoflavone reductase
MRLLILGGTEFVGRAVADSALAGGWDVTVLNRGRKEPPPGVTVLVGDRTAPNWGAALAGGEWDAVVDTWSGAPRVVRDAARLLSERADRFVYVSSCSVYAWPPPAGYDETAPVCDGAPDAGEVPYQEAKRGGELAAVEAFGEGRTLLPRPGLILGPRENVGRLPWWLARMVRGGRVLAPGPRDAPVRFVDVRDLAEWTLGALRAGLSGPYNLTSGPGHSTMGEVLEECVRVTGSTAERVWTDPGTILAAGVEPWNELPIWVPPVHARDLYHAVYAMNTDRAVEAGLRCRPTGETVADTWAWLLAASGQEAGGAVDATAVTATAAALGRTGLAPEREAEILGG